MTASENEVVTLPLPEDDGHSFDLTDSAQIVVEDVSQGEGHFAVDYRRC